MAMSINTNVLSLNAQRNLSTSAADLATSLQRLSSGLRINSARDDAAGLAISERFTTQIRGLTQAARNANDGISLAQTTEGALAELTNNLQRIRELAVQAANASNSGTDRAALDQEVQQRLSEVDRIASVTAFNGQKVLDGSFGTAQFQVGANVGETISISLAQGVKANQIGQIATSTTKVTSTALSGTGTIQVGNGQVKSVAASVAGSANGQTAGSAYAKAAAITAAGVPGLTVQATNYKELAITNITAAAGTVSLKINDVSIYAAVATTNGFTTQEITDAINGKSATTGVTAGLSGGKLYLTAADGRDIKIGYDVATSTGGLAADATPVTLNGITYTAGILGTVAQADANNAAAINNGSITLAASQAITIANDTTALGAAATINVDTTTLATQNVLTAAAANSTMQRIDAALSSVSTLRSALGSIQSRFESTITSLQAATENLSASRGRILDTDFAAETANLTKAQILQQAGTAILAQANAAPQSVLSLLK
jgi:flagellin